MTYICLLAGLLCAATVAIGAQVPATGCINVTISDVLGIGECLGPANFCDSTTGNGLNQAAMKITECAVQGILANGPHDVITNALPVLTALLPSMGPLGGFDLPSMLSMLGGLNSMNLCGANGCGLGSFDQGSLCGGSVTIGLPSIGNLDKCFDKTTIGCVQGSTDIIDGALSVFQAVKCTVYELPGSPLAELHKVVGCALVNALRAAESTNADLRMVLYAFESAVRNTLDLQNCPSLV